MTRKQLILLLIAVALVVAVTSAVFNLSPLNWFTQNTPGAAGVRVVAADFNQA